MRVEGNRSAGAQGFDATAAAIVVTMVGQGLCVAAVVKLLSNIAKACYCVLTYARSMHALRPLYARSMPTLCPLCARSMPALCPLYD